MVIFDGRAILIDVEGTTSSISFVYDVLFEHAKQHVGDFLLTHRDDAEIMQLAANISKSMSREIILVLLNTTVERDTSSRIVDGGFHVCIGRRPKPAVHLEVFAFAAAPRETFLDVLGDFSAQPLYRPDRMTDQSVTNFGGEPCHGASQR